MLVTEIPFLACYLIVFYTLVLAANAGEGHQLMMVILGGAGYFPVFTDVNVKEKCELDSIMNRKAFSSGMWTFSIPNCFG
ncbi:hypothetical protein B5X24_HaOG201928 [Helicoverpa armigera]|nr:hypothetical protein B5X24_HaOG201928 [Helicoverpa armigera]